MKRKSGQRGITVIGALLLVVVLGFMALVAMKVIPMYIQYFTIKSTVEGIRKEPQLAQMGPMDIEAAIQRRFDIGNVRSITARDLKLRNDRNGRVLDLVYEDDQPMFYGLHVVLKINEVIPLTPP